MSANKDEPRETKADYLLDGSPEAVALVREARGLPPLNADWDATQSISTSHSPDGRTVPGLLAGILDALIAIAERLENAR